MASPDPWRRTVVLAAVLLAAGSCALFLPERFALNAPLGNLLFGWGTSPPPPDVLGERVRVPEGFTVAIWARDLPNARMIRFTGGGDLLVSAPREGRVVLVERDRDGDGRADGARVLIENLRGPHGIDLRDGWLYVAETDAVGRIRIDESKGRVEGPFERVVTGLPRGGNHWTRTLRFGPDGWLYVTVGSSCNVCVEDDPRRAAMLRFRPDGRDGEIHATGLRNAVDFDWRPGTDELYATDNGRDLLGDDFPPCELNRIVAGGFYGWPFANGDRVPDPDLGRGREEEIARSIPPVHGFAAHTAPLGIAFLRGEKLPPDYRGAAVVALHGSWNRTRKIGYELVTLHWNDDGDVEERKLLTGLEKNEDVIGRPVGVAEGPDGAIYVSDDYAGVIYRITHGGGDGARSNANERDAPARRGVASVADPESLERGRALYERYECARCHEAERAEQGVVVKELAGLGDRHTVESLATYLAAPNPPMPVFDLDAEERRDLARFLIAGRS